MQELVCKMKIAIISINMYSKALNYACPLHNFAFQQFLRKNGIESEVLNYYPIYFSDFNMEDPYSYYKEKAEHCEALLKKQNDESDSNLNVRKHYEEYTQKAAAWEKIREKRKLRNRKFCDFIEKYYVKTEKAYNHELLEIEDPGFDCYICVTDVIWKSEPGFGFDRGFFLGSKCMENKWKISYAASRGPSEYSPEEEEQFVKYVNDIDFVSVREESLKGYIEEKCQKEVSLVLDPVFLHDADFYRELAVLPEEEHFIMVYCVVENVKLQETIMLAATFAKQHHLKIIELTDKPLSESNFAAYEDVDSTLHYTAGIEEWLGYFIKADYVFTNSFHASCFSIILQKEFFVGPRNGDKIGNLLQIFGLGNRRVSKKTNFETEPFVPIDYSKVQAILEQKREESAEFILSAIRYASTHERPERDYHTDKEKLCFPMRFNSGKLEDVTSDYEEGLGQLRKFANSYEYTPKEELIRNDGSTVLSFNQFKCKDEVCIGWNPRFRIDNHSFWLLENKKSCLLGEHDAQTHGPRCLLRPGDRVPFLPVNEIKGLVLEAAWDKIVNYSFEELQKLDPRITLEEVTNLQRQQQVVLSYHSNKKGEKVSWKYQEKDGKVERLESEAVEFWPKDGVVTNHGENLVLANKFAFPDRKFVGWYLRFTSKGCNRWYLANGKSVQRSQYDEAVDGAKLLLKPGEKIPFLAKPKLTTITLEAVWEETFLAKVKRHLGIGVTKETDKKPEAKIK